MIGLSRRWIHAEVSHAKSQVCSVEEWQSRSNCAIAGQARVGVDQIFAIAFLKIEFNDGAGEIPGDVGRAGVEMIVAVIDSICFQIAGGGGNPFVRKPRPSTMQSRVASGGRMTSPMFSSIMRAR